MSSGNIWKNAEPRVISMVIVMNNTVGPLSTTPPFVQKVDGIWSQTPLDRFLIDLTVTSTAGPSDLGVERSASAARQLAHRFWPQLEIGCCADFRYGLSCDFEVTE
jgi:hypothetical protein